MNNASVGFSNSWKNRTHLVLILLAIFVVQMKPAIPFTFREQHLWLSTNRTLFWEEKKTLIVADIHAGKTGHFRKSGIPIPQNIFKSDLQTLFSEIQYFGPKSVILAGDFSHSEENKELDLFSKWRESISSVTIHLVKGNHDLLPRSWYAQNNIEVHSTFLEQHPFGVIHDARDITENTYDATRPYFFTGHLHPGVALRGAGKQSLRFPCFCFMETYCILPAFSRFTGLKLMEIENAESVFAVSGEAVIKIK